MIQYPKIRKTVKKFIMNENGNITKSNLVKIGVLLAASAGFIAQKNVGAYIAAHSSDVAPPASGHNNGGDQYNAPSQCGGAHDSAHANDNHGSWGHDSGDHTDSGISPYSCNAHQNQLSLVTNSQDGSVTGQHTHGTQHSSTGDDNWATDECVEHNNGGHNNDEHLSGSPCNAYKGTIRVDYDGHCNTHNSGD